MKNNLTQQRLRHWAKRSALVFLLLIVVLLFVVLPIGASYLVTNSRFHFPERGPKTPEEVGLTVTPVEFNSPDGIDLRGWWSAGDESHPVILFCHGLNRSRIEMLQRAAEANQRGYGVLLFDVRNHGESGNSHTTLGINESKDVCAASDFVKQKAGSRQQMLWGVSMGASTALLSARKCPRFSAIISDSSFLSFRETIAHHVRLYFHLPAFPIANLIVAITGWRMGFDPDEGDVEAAVRGIGNVPVLFIAGGADRRMPPALAERLFGASASPQKELLVVPGAGHGESFNKDRKVYLDAVFGFLEKVRRPN
jgi:pimeloyl-ACP methyl ester carboxylesterase